MPNKPPETAVPVPHKASVRSLAGQAHVPVDEAVLRLQEAGLDVHHPSAKLEGAEVRKARELLGMRAWGDKGPPARRLTETQLVVQCLRPLREKGKVGRTHTTPIEHVYGHGVPDHQKDEAREQVERFVMDGTLCEKQSQGRRHVWLSREGLALLAGAEKTEAEGDV
jgi:hypothetical protein